MHIVYNKVLNQYFCTFHIFTYIYINFTYVLNINDEKKCVQFVFYVYKIVHDNRYLRVSYNL